MHIANPCSLLASENFTPLSRAMRRTGRVISKNGGEVTGKGRVGKRGEHRVVGQTRKAFAMKSGAWSCAADR